MKTENLCTLPLMLLAISYLATARSIDHMCKKGGPIYMNHPEDCEKFVQCYTDALGKPAEAILSCPFSTYWSNDFLTCLPVEQVMCNMDKCDGQPDGSVRAGKGNCRGFWECNNGRSEPRCCPLHQRFEDKLGCINTENEDDECKDTCLGVEYDWSNETANETFVCNRTPVIGKPILYKEEGYTRPCSPGTVFDQDKCNCIVAKEPAVKAACKREIYLPFTSDHSDMSGNQHHIGNDNVFVNGSAYFNGEDSRLSIPFFNNNEHIESIVIRLNYTSASGKTGSPQLLISNSGCEKTISDLPSIVVFENEKDVIFEVGTTKNRMSSVAVPQPGSLSEDKILEYKFLNENFIGSVNEMSSDVAVNGNLRNVQCDLSIGGLPEYATGPFKDMANFEGVINELSIYLCDPEPAP